MNTKKVLIVNKDFCTGCRTCEIVCTLKHSGSVNPALARLKVVSSHKDHSSYPLICRHCKNPSCKAACPIPNAMYIDEKTGAVVVNEEYCTQCLACVEACPFAAIQVGPNKEILKCDLCGGNPLCAEYCPPVRHAYPNMPQPIRPCLQYIEPTMVAQIKRQAVTKEE